MYKKIISMLVASTVAIACGHGDEDPFSGNEVEVITTVVLTFTPELGGDPTVALFDDPDGDGGEPPRIDAIELGEGSYTLAVQFENRLESTPEDITVEVADESQEHQIFFTGSAVNGPASDNPGAPLLHSYDDQDVNNLPIGLTNVVVASSGSGDLIVTLRHLPPVGGESIKSEEIGAEVAEFGFSAIGGSTDAQVTFALSVP